MPSKKARLLESERFIEIWQADKSLWNILSDRSSRPEVFCEKGVLRNFSKFTGKHLCQSLFFNKVAGGACNFIKKETLAQVFPVNFEKFLRTPFFTEHLW